MHHSLPPLPPLPSLWLNANQLSHPKGAFRDDARCHLSAVAPKVIHRGRGGGSGGYVSDVNGRLLCVHDVCDGKCDELRELLGDILQVDDIGIMRGDELRRLVMTLFSPKKCLCVPFEVLDQTLSRH